MRPTDKSTVTRPFYAQVFICARTRAVHTELVWNKTALEFQRAFARFSNRRGLPLEILSDNAAEFIRSDAELQEVLQEANKNIKDQGKHGALHVPIFPYITVKQELIFAHSPKFSTNALKV